MRDPFADKSDKSFHREIQMWMTVLMCLLVAFLYLAIKRMSGTQEEIPAHILQSGVAQVTLPNRFDAAPNPFPKPPRLSSVSRIRTDSFSTNVMPAEKPDSETITKPSSKPNFGIPNQPKAAKRFSGISHQPTGTAVTKNTSLPFPQPSFAKPRKEAVDVTASAEAIGRERAKQLAAITSGLPERLNQIQSSVRRATAELPLEKVKATKDVAVVADNGFETSSPLKPSAQIPRSPISLQPNQFAVEAPVKVVKPIAVRPAVEKTFAIKPREDSPALSPVQRTEDENLHNEISRNQNPKANGFAPLPSLRPFAERPLGEPELSDISVQAPGLPEPAATEVAPVKRIPRSSPDLKQHVVQSGDSFFTIAQQHYGDAQWFRALYLANQTVIDGGDLPVGVSVSIPTTAELTRQFPEYAVKTADEQPTEAQERIYVTQSGDTLFDIARRKTGQGSRFSEIISRNEFRLPTQIRASDRLPEGLRLVLPESTLQ